MLQRGADWFALRSQHAPTVASLTNAVNLLIEQNTRLTAEVYEVKRQLRKESIRQVVEDIDRAEIERLEELRDDCAKVLGLLQAKGAITAAEITEVLSG